jgi:hypothetical protein
VARDVSLTRTEEKLESFIGPISGDLWAILARTNRLPVDGHGGQEGAVITTRSRFRLDLGDGKT